MNYLVTFLVLFTGWMLAVLIAATVHPIAGIVIFAVSIAVPMGAKRGRALNQ